ncbi:MAG TPA: DUF3341 domain-containing protein [Steroidobacteraceae bacterium]|jgi:hypothetical protein|nr:DUF3341 domain-containing protein [Steroidobacteraceae bacterium]
MKALLAGFATEQGLKSALQRLSAARIDYAETYTPMPPDADASGSPVPLWMFVGGMLGFIGFFLLMTYADVRAYPLDIGGRPTFAWPTFIPIAFELGALCAMVTGFFGYFALCRMPVLYDPVDECESFREASRNGWFLTVHSDDPELLDRVRSTLQALDPASLEEFSA